MAYRSQITYVSNKTKCLLKIAEAKGSFDAVAVIEQIPIRRLRLKPLRFLMSAFEGKADISDRALL